MAKSFLLPVNFVGECDTCGCDEINDVSGRTILLVQGDTYGRLDSIVHNTASMGLEIEHMLNHYDMGMDMLQKAVEFLEHPDEQRRQYIIDNINGFLMRRDYDWESR